MVTIVVIAGALRGLWLTADPANGTATNAGVVWHDEGAWVHNARNQALWGAWRTDEWNPMFIAPVFTGLEAAAFNAFGVGTWQARTVPATSSSARMQRSMPDATSFSSATTSTRWTICSRGGCRRCNRTSRGVGRA